jgi:glycosyltransferase involved in cell wall biosynthesis
MKILIDGQTLLTPEINRGIGTYFKNTIEHILENDFTSDFYINTPPGPHLNSFSPWAREKLSILDNPAYDIRALSSKKNAANLYSDTVNNEIQKRGINLYWSPNALMDNVFVAARANADCRFAVTIFDLIVAVMEKHYAKHRSSSAMAIYRKKLKQLEADYDLYFHISRHTKSDFIGTLKVEDKMHVVTPLAVDKSFRPYPFPKVVAPIEYVLYPGGFDPRKNMDRAVEAFAALQKRYGDDERIRATQLWIVCGLDSASKAGMLNRAKRLGLNGKVKLTGFVSNAALVELYQKARCLFFPSLYEGFGLPLLEGLACGLPAACSNTSSLPEVGGGLANYFDPYNVEDMADSLYQVLQAPVDLQSRLIRYEYSRRFSWQKTALATLRGFAECVSQLPKPSVDIVNGTIKATLLTQPAASDEGVE